MDKVVITQIQAQCYIFLLRLPTFTQIFFDYLNNHFQLHLKRTFHSIETAYRLASDNSATFFLSEFLVNNKALILVREKMASFHDVT
mgnify:CR=1 FL=1